MFLSGYWNSPGANVILNGFGRNHSMPWKYVDRKQKAVKLINTGLVIIIIALVGLVLIGDKFAQVSGADLDFLIKALILI